jgi:hypothetical protein
VILIAAIILNETTGFKTFEITVKKADVISLTDTQKVMQTLNSLSIGYANGDNAISVTANLTLPIVSPYDDVSIVWSSSDVTVITDVGIVTSSANMDEAVTLTAIVSLNEISQSKDFHVIVKKRETLSDAQKIAQVISNLDIEYAQGDSASAVSQNLVLADGNSLDYGATIVWSSSDSSVVTDEGTVFRPTGADTQVTLTGTVFLNAVSQSKDFVITVKKIDDISDPVTDADKVFNIKNSLDIGYAIGDSETAVTQNLAFLLTDALGYGSTIVWTSDNAAITVAGSVGTVNRQTADIIVTLTATVYLGDAHDSKEFSLTVKKLVGNVPNTVWKNAVAEVSELIGVNLDGWLPALGQPTRVDVELFDADYWYFDIRYSQTPGSFVSKYAALLEELGWQDDGDGYYYRYFGGIQVYVLPNVVSGQPYLDIFIYRMQKTWEEVLDFVNAHYETDLNGVFPNFPAPELFDCYLSDNGSVIFVQLIGLDQPESFVAAYSEALEKMNWKTDAFYTAEWELDVYVKSIDGYDVYIVPELYENAYPYLNIWLEGDGQIDDPISDEEKVSNVRNSLEITYATGDSAEAVTQNLGLPTSGAYGATISWQSDNDAVTIAGDSGIVQRQDDEAIAVLTATIRLNDAVVTKTFTVKVKPLNSNHDPVTLTVSRSGPIDDAVQSGKIDSYLGGLDSNISITYSGKINNSFGSVFHAANQIRLYNSSGKNTGEYLTITAKSGYQIVSITVIFTLDGSASCNYVSGTAKIINGTTATITNEGGNANTRTGHIRITQIVIVYQEI